ncbi:MAG: cytochrome-c peroxidase, partial [Janthinobacterium lividum]
MSKVHRSFAIPHVRLLAALLPALLSLSACEKTPPAAGATALAPVVPVTVPIAAGASVPLATPGAGVPYRAAPRAGRPVTLSAAAELGKRMFFDASLSASGRMACASCHSPAHAYGPPNGLAVQLGGTRLRDQGARAVPSLRYLEHNPNFTIGPNSSVPDTDAALAPPPPPAGDVKVAAVAKGGNVTPAQAAQQAAAAANVPQGGLDWDGRADSFQDQADGPFLDPHEMANVSDAAVLERLRRTPYAGEFRKLFGAAVFDNAPLAMSEALFALARYQFEDPGFHPYDSKYDYYLAGDATLTPQEAHGLRLFEDPKKGNCSSCHIDKPSVDGMFPPAFTDFQFEAFGAPRNAALLANRDPRYHDLGLCGPMRRDLRGARAYCGLFKTPTLRNVATRQVFFHNGVFHTLDDVMHFYVERETDPARWYPRRRDGTIDVYDDLPAQYRKNVDTADAPFDRKAGDAPALNA